MHSIDDLDEELEVNAATAGGSSSAVRNRRPRQAAAWIINSTPSRSRYAKRSADRSKKSGTRASRRRSD